MRKVMLVLAGVVIVGLGIYFIIVNKQGGRDSSETFILPKLEVMNFQIKSIEEEQIMLEMQAMIDNKMPLSFRIDSVTYQILLEGEEIAKSTYPDSITLEANDSSELTLPLTLYQQQISSTMDQVAARNTDSIAYDLYAQVYTNLPFMEDKPIDVELSKEVPFIRKIEVSLDGASMQKFGLQETEITLTVEVINPNQFAFQASHIAYLFNVDGDSLASGNIEEMTSIDPHDTSYIEIPVRLKLAEIGESAFNLLFNPEQTDYSFTVTSTLVSELNMLDDSEIKVQSAGKLKELLN